MPSVLFLNRVYPSEAGATGYRLADLAVRLRAMGWRVHVVTAGPESPWRRACPRALRFLMAYGVMIWRALRAPRHDVIVTLTDPPLLAALGVIVRAVSGARLVHWSHDVYPAILGAVGGTGGRILEKLLTPLARWALGRHDHVVAIGDCMAAKLRTLTTIPLSVLRNVADTTVTAQPRADAALRERLGTTGRFVVGYAGTVGLVHDFSALLDAAESLSQTDPAVLFWITQTGSGCRRLEQAVAARGLGHMIRFVPWTPAHNFHDVLQGADVQLVCLAPAALGLSVPNKMATALAVGRPCLFVGPADSDVAHVLEKGACGVVVPPHDGAGLAAAIRHYHHTPSLWADHAARASQTAKDFYDADAHAQAFSALLMSVLKEGEPHHV